MPFVTPLPPVWPEAVTEWLGSDAESVLSAGGPVWFAIKVQPRCEKHVARGLTQRASAYFLCLRTTTRVYQRRRVISQVPLFPGYLFAASDEDRLAALWQLPHVAQVLKPPSQDSFLRELKTLFRLINSGVPLTPEEQLQPGQEARITRGCLAGITGTVIENRNGMKLVVGTSLLGRGASVEVTPEMVERI